MVKGNKMAMRIMGKDLMELVECKYNFDLYGRHYEIYLWPWERNHFAAQIAEPTSVDEKR